MSTTEDIGSLPGVTGMQFTTELLTLKRGYVPLPASAPLHGAWAPSDYGRFPGDDERTP